MELQELVKLIRQPENKDLSQNKLASKYNTSRYLVRKAMAEIAGLESDDEILEDPDSALATTANGCVSVKKSTSSPVAVGDIWSWGNNNDNKALIVSVSEETKEIGYILGWQLEQGYEPDGGEINCSFKNWKKKKNLTHLGADHVYLYCVGRAQEEGTTDLPAQAIIEKYKDDFKQVDSSEYQGDPDELKKNGDPISESSEVVEATTSDMKAITDVASNCPFRLVASTRSINVIDSDGKVGAITADQGSIFQSALQAIKDQNWGSVLEICGIRKRRAVEYQKIMALLGFRIEHGCVVMLDGTGSIKLGGLESVMKRIEQFAIEGNEAGILSLSRFVNRVLDNPTPDIMNRVIEFIRFADVEIDEEGYVIAYKYVNSNYKDSYTNKLDNSPGSTVVMKRVLVDTNIDNECSQGLHVCALGYVFQFWNSNKRLVKVRLSPRDIVAIPRDYKGQKIRCARYSVLEDVTSQFLNRKIPVDFKGFFA